MLKQHTFTASDLMLMSEAGLFKDQRVELIDGVIYDMSPANPDHEDIVDELNETFVQTFSGRARVRVQNALDIGNPTWLPHPDLVLVKRCRYGNERPKPEDVYLLIEVSHTTLPLDKGRKLEMYATLGIQDYWIADLTKREWIVHRNPAPGRYRDITQAPFGKALAPLAFPNDAHVWL